MGIELKLQALPLDSEFARLCRQCGDPDEIVFELIDELFRFRLEKNRTILPETALILKALNDLEKCHPELGGYNVDLDRYFDKLSYLLSPAAYDLESKTDISVLINGTENFGSIIGF